MAFHDVRFPARISYGTQRGPGFLTNITKLPSGAEERVSRRSFPQHKYDAAYGIRSYADLVLVNDFYIARLGPGNSFRFQDPFDCSTGGQPTVQGATYDATEDVWIVNHGAQNEVLGQGDGVTTDFQLVKRYTSGLNTVVRKITRPVQTASGGYVKSAVDGVAKTLGVDFTVNYSTGVITYGTAPGVGLDVTAGCQFDVPVRFGIEIDDLLAISMDDFDQAGIPGAIPLVEEIDGTTVDEEFYWGGASEQVFSSDVVLEPLMGRVVALNPGTTGLTVFLPPTTEYAYGGIHFVLTNISANSLTIETGVASPTLSAGATAYVFMATVAGVKEWKVAA